MPPSGRQGPIVPAAPIADEDILVDDISEPSSHAGPIDHSPSVIVEDDDSCFCSIQNTVRIFGKQRIQDKIERDGQSMHKANQKVPHRKRL